ncbi:MAG: VOC family protein [Reichenbachiella sp.]|uniref:VOC family protein n=1 Tax=Reichenbachiella sp. TaxID=2184521 RepID=UPI003267F0BB
MADLDDPKPYFTAILVKDMTKSLDWYQTTLGYEIIDSKEYPEMKFKQANLKRGDSALELIELGNAQKPEDLIADFNSKSKITGLFKVGFSVTKFDLWVEHLENAGAQFHGNVVEDPVSKKRMLILLDPDGNRIQIFER